MGNLKGRSEPYLGCLVAYGTYTGNGGNNLAVAHGLGKTPKGIYVVRDNGTMGAWIGLAGNIAGFAVTAWNDTNFYVGNVADLVTTVNQGATGYHYTAFA